MNRLVPDLRPRRRRRLCAVALVVFAGIVRPAVATTADSAAHRAFLEQELEQIRTEHDVPGIAAVLVQGREVLFSGGYGWADLSRRVPMDPDRTLFPMGSISKLLTTIAVLQLAEKGAVDLHADVRTYLDRETVDSRFAAPITLHHLLTHTDGFDVRWLVGGAARVPEKVLPLAAMAARLPPRTLPPGEIYLYSDVGMTLAGYIVQRVSGQPFGDYVDQHIFQPLGMSRSTFLPRRKSYARDRATGYDYGADGYSRAAPVVYPHANPASGLTGPVADMAPLMSALLTARKTKDGPLLQPRSVEAMWTKQFSHHPSFAGTGYGFYEFVHRGRRAWVHGGLLPGFTTVIILIPDANVGLCLAANRFDLIAAFEDELLRKTLDHFLPVSSAPDISPPAPAPSPPATGLAGVYRCDQYSRFSLDKIFVLAGLATEVDVRVEPDGSLLFQPQGTRWQPVAPRLYRREDSEERVLFQTDAAGRGTRILGSVQFMSYHRVTFWDDFQRHIPIAGGLLLVACIGGLVATWKSLRWLGFRGPNCDSVVHVQRLAAMLVPLPLVGMFAGLAFVLRDLDFIAAAFGEPDSIAALRLVPLLAAALALGLLGLSLACARRDRVDRRESALYAVSSAAILLLLPLLIQWQLVRLPSPLVAFVVRCLTPSVS